MTNLEKYLAEIIIKNASCEVYALRTGNKGCSECKLEECKAENLKWLKSEYEELDVDWSKVAVDTLVEVSDDGFKRSFKRYFARYHDGAVWCFTDGATSKTIGNQDSVLRWRSARLVEE